MRFPVLHCTDTFCSTLGLELTSMEEDKSCGPFAKMSPQPLDAYSGHIEAVIEKHFTS